MTIRQALPTDAQTIQKLVHKTIKEIYPHYYPQGAVAFFLVHHSIETIAADIAEKQVYVIEEEVICGTVTLKDNEIGRLFVLPEYQGHGYGRILLDFAETTIASHSHQIFLDASLPSKRIYLNRNYREVDSHCISVKNGDYLCYDVMEKTIPADK